MDDSRPAYVAFHGTTCIAQGSLPEVIRGARTAMAADGLVPVLVFDARTSEQIDFGPDGDLPDRATPAPTPDHHTSVTSPKLSGPGRPRPGVVAREVTLLPRHWEWLASQPDGASVVLRRLVDQARRDALPLDTVRKGQECSYRFMAAMAGNLPGFEAASRALFAGRAADFASRIAAWPPDLRAHVQRLAGPVFQQGQDAVPQHA